MTFAPMDEVCDCHMHIYGPADVYPVAPTNPFPAPDAPLDAYRRIMAGLGIQRAVIVQPAAYGFDNRCTLDAMAALGDAARGVAVVGADAPDDELRRLTEAGVRGVRFHMLPGGVLPWADLDAVAARVHDHGWHVQLQLDGRDLPERRALIERFPGTVVIDHVGKFLEPVAVDDPAFRTLLALVDSGRVWVKLSAVYETSKTGAPDYADVGVLAKALVAAAPERLVWASNWPHPSVQDDPPDEDVLKAAIWGWMGDAATRRRILVDNPAALYGF